MEHKTIICVDTSGSTYGNTTYFKKIAFILESTEPKIVISWNSGAEIVQSYMFDPDGGTRPQAFLNIIKDFDYDYDLIVTTDGLIYDDDLKICKDIMKSSNIVNRIKSFKIYFIGETKQMNLKISSLFNKVDDKKIIINDGEPINVISNINIEKLTLKDFADEKTLIASVLSLVQLYPQKKQEFRAQICKVSNRLLAQLASNLTISEFYKNNDIEGCVEFVKKYDNCNKKQLQQTVSKLLLIFDGEDDYSLSHLANTAECREQDVEADSNGDSEDDDTEGDFICDILYIKCSLPCILVKLIEDSNSENVDKYSIIPDKLSKKISENPFLILNHEDIIRKIIKRVDHQIIDLQAYNKLEDKSLDPFTREEVKGAFIFHNDKVDYNLLFKNNNRTLSFMFGENNKLPGNKAIWNVLFLYILLKYHVVWREHKSKLKEEIKYIFKNVKTFVALTPLLNPSIIDDLGVCLWYSCLVSPRAFENTSSNVLRFMENSEKLVEFYSYISDENFEDLIKKVKVWNLWKYFVRNRVNKNLKLEVMSQIQNHEIINDITVLFSGESKCGSEIETKCKCKRFDLEGDAVVKLYKVFEKIQQPRLYDRINFDDMYKGDAVSYKTVTYDPDDEILMEHVAICVTTCKPTVICSITGKHWKECAGNYDIKRESYFRLFKHFCIKNNRYPNNENELLAFHSNKINFDKEDLIVYPTNAKVFFRVVFDKYVNVMKEYTVAEYLEISNKDCGEIKRLEAEEACQKCDGHKRGQIKT